MHAKIALGAVAALGVVAGIAIYTRSQPHGEVPQHAEGSVTPHLDTAGGPRGGGSGSALEKPWLSEAATEQIVGKDGALGPLFDGVVLGGPAPADAVRARIAAFAKANDVAIDFEVVADKLVAVRFTVTYGGCCGYEGADKLGLRFQRPRSYGGDGARGVWANDWAVALPDGTHVRTDLRFGRVSARWERTLGTKDMLEHADALIGMDPTAVAAAAGDKWRAIIAGDSYLFELPYPFAPSSRGVAGTRTDRYDLGVVASIDHGRIHEVKIQYDEDDRLEAELDKLATARWGTPRKSESERSWRTQTRAVTHAFRTLTIRGVP